MAGSGAGGIRRTFRRALVTHAPPRIRALLRRGKRDVRRAGYRLRRLRGDSVEQADLAAGLREVGLREGDGVFVHTAMSRFGEILGGPATVVAALEEVLGSRSLIAMPAFPLTGGMVEHLEADPVFDVRATPSRMGALTEHFRRLPGTARSLHPTHSVAARGPGAEELVAGHAEAATPFGEGTPFARMVERGMHQVWLGTGIEIFTLYHTFECLQDDEFPLPVLREQAMAARCIDEHGRERVVATRVHDPGIAARKVASREPMRQALEAAGVLKSARVGAGEILAARLPELMQELERLLRRGVTIYDPRLLESPAGKT